MANGYVSDWKRTIRGAIDSYVEVLRRLNNARNYGSSGGSDDIGGVTKKILSSIKIPLLWGTF